MNKLNDPLFSKGHVYQQHNLDLHSNIGYLTDIISYFFAWHNH